MGRTVPTFVQLIQQAAERWKKFRRALRREDQPHFDRRYPLIREARVPVHFISYEPAIGPLAYLWGKPEWLICGGESGPGARMMEPAWARSVRDQCAASGVA